MRIRFTILFLWVATGTFGQAGIADNKLSLEQCIVLALQNNQDAKNAYFQTLENKAFADQAKANRLPYVNAGVNHALNQGRSINPFDNSYVNQNLTSANYNINTGINLWNRQRISNYIRQTSLDLEASEQDLQQKKDDITIRVILAFMDVLNRQEQLKAAEEQKISITAQYNRLKVLEQSGAAPPDDLADIQGQVKENGILIFSMKNAVENAKILLAEILNIPYEKDWIFEETDKLNTLRVYPYPAEEVYNRSLQNMGLIKSAELKSQSADYAIKTARAERYPTLSLTAGLGSNYSSAAFRNIAKGATEMQTNNYVKLNGNNMPVFTQAQNYDRQAITYVDQLKNNYGSNVSLNLGIPIFNNTQSRLKIKRAEILKQQAEYNLSSVKIQLGNTINKAYTDMQAAFEVWAARQEQEKAYREFYRVALIKFEAGAINSVDFLNAKNKLDVASVQLIAAKFDYIFKTKVLDYYRGNNTL